MYTSVMEVPPLKRCMKARKLVVVDIENVIGGAVHDCRSASWAKRQIESAIDLRTGDHVVLGTSHIGLLETYHHWPRARHVVRSGPDGADLALLEVLDENVAARFGEVVVVSGDGIFTETVAALAGQGLLVSVVAHPDGIARRLRLAAHDTVYLPDRYQPQYGDVA